LAGWYGKEFCLKQAAEEEEEDDERTTTTTTTTAKQKAVNHLELSYCFLNLFTIEFECLIMER